MTVEQELKRIDMQLEKVVREIRYQMIIGFLTEDPKLVRATKAFLKTYT